MGPSPNRTGTGIGIVILVALGVATAHPGVAQVTFGSPADPPRIAIGGGAFDVLPNSNRSDSKPTGLALAEYRFGDVLWIVAPFVGVLGTGQGSFYGYGGVGFDINIGEKFVVTPSTSVSISGALTGGRTNPTSSCLFLSPAICAPVAS